jgi:simple sugar transport system ATP-binding protein
VFGIAGVDGNGQKELAEAIAGQRAVVAGEIRLDGVPINRAPIAERLKRGLRYVTDDRLGEGIVSDFPLSMNLVLKRIGAPPFWRRGMVRRGAIERHATELVERYDVRTPSVDTPIGRLSGGNIQKALLARELAQKPRAMVYNKPTHGLDLANTSAMRERIREEAEDGVATIVISTELDELLGLCARIAVMSRGSLQGIVENGPNAERRIGSLMIGGGDA